MKEIQKLDTDQFKAIENKQNEGTIYSTIDFRELQIQTLAEKINEIIDYIKKSHE